MTNKVHIKISSGFECDIEETKIDDYRLLKLLREVETDASAVVDVVSMVLGGDEERFLASLAEKDGRIPNGAVMAAIREIFESLKSKKK